MAEKRDKFLLLKNIALKQCGYFTAKQAIECGYNQNLHHYQVVSGQWIRSSKGLYSLASIPPSKQSLWLRWLLWSRNNQEEIQGALCSFTALDYYGLLPDDSGITYMEVPDNLRKRGADSSLRLEYREHRPKEQIISCGVWHVIHPRLVIENLSQILIDRGLYHQVLQKAGAAGILTEQYKFEPPKISPIKASPNTVFKDTQNLSIFSENDLVAFAVDSDKKFTSTERTAEMVKYRNELSRFSSLKHYEGTIRPASSFTLIEMLVVISIISILAAMLMPSLLNAINTANGVLCAGNMRQMALAITQYADDSNDWFPPATILNYKGTGVTRSWYQAGGYLADQYMNINWASGDYHKGTILDCPVQDIGVGANSVDYTYNQCLGNKSASVSSRIIHRRRDVARPSKLIVFADVLGSEKFGSTGANLAVFEAWGYDWFSTFDFRHLEKANLLSVDLHVTQGYFSDISLNDTTTQFNTRNP